MKPTEEQQQIVTCPAKTLVVNAYAGTGKTSTLVQYAEARPGERMTYLAFNRAIKEEASKKFPKNVRCVTTHGLAFPRFGTKYQHKLGNVKPFHLTGPLRVGNVEAGVVIEVITAFLSSPAPRFGEEHTYMIQDKSSKGKALELAEKAWAMMCDTGNAAVPMPHDGYLKLFQVSNPVIGDERTTILFDEAQDANPVTLAIVNAQPCRKVFVGDHYQAIYGFRKAVNAMRTIPADQRHFLTHSFRFGEGIAGVASAILADWRGERRPIVGRGPVASRFKVSANSPHAFLSRANATLFGQAVAVMQKGLPFAFSGGVENYRFEQIEEAYRLFARQSVRDPFVASFSDWSEMKAYGEALDDREVKSLVRIVEEFQGQIPTLVQQIRAAAISTPTGNEIMLSTAHKAKGLEWRSVILADDFVELIEKPDEKGELIKPDAEEVNILYVGVTRATEAIQLPSSVSEWLWMSDRSGLLGGAPARKPSAAPALSVSSAKPPAPATTKPSPKIATSVYGSMEAVMEAAKTLKKGVETLDAVQREIFIDAATSFFADQIQSFNAMREGK